MYVKHIKEQTVSLKRAKKKMENSNRPQKVQKSMINTVPVGSDIAISHYFGNF